MRRPTGRRLYSRHTFLRDRLQDGATEWRTIDSTLPDPRHARCTTHHEHLPRSEEHKSELQSLMRTSYAVYCLKKKTKNYTKTITLIPTRYKLNNTIYNTSNIHNSHHIINTP